MTPDEWANVHASMAMHESKAVTAEIVGDTVVVSSPYNAKFVERVKRFDPAMGKWNAKKRQWSFPLDRVNEVRALYKEIYGDDGFEQDGTTVVTIDVDKALAAGMRFYTPNKGLMLLGKMLARIITADAPVRPEAGVSVIKGGFTIGGSQNMPTIGTKKGTVLVVSDMPLDRTEMLASELGGDASGITFQGARMAPANMDPVPHSPADAIEAPAGSGAALADSLAAKAAAGTAGAAGTGAQAPQMTAKQLTEQLMMDSFATALGHLAKKLPADVVASRLAARKLTLTK